ncbi:hypothetical protein chiPu_0021558 [Chiloscyllium punctatum]|uniref:EF-hand domain-containing protein n=2 Tax=Chiloscyllium punctatum TaxID=137246 RepID=A0A401RHK3_CHIPU|nr:hypothetical protein [Chiloscyllium punctatum]
MLTLITTFQKYAGTDNDGSTLSKPELKQLLESQLPNFIPKDEKCKQTFMDTLDRSGDEKVDFMEYVTALACMTTICHDVFTKCVQQSSK